MSQTSERPTTRTNIVLDTELVETAMRMTGLRTRRALVDHALRELIRREEQMQLLDLKGRIDWDGNLDEMRTDGETRAWE